MEGFVRSKTRSQGSGALWRLSRKTVNRKSWTQSMENSSHPVTIQVPQEEYFEIEICIQASYWGKFSESIVIGRVKERGLDRESSWTANKALIWSCGESSWDELEFRDISEWAEDCGPFYYDGNRLLDVSCLQKGVLPLEAFSSPKEDRC